MIIVNVALIRLKLKEARPPEGAVLRPLRVPVGGVLASLALPGRWFSLKLRLSPRRDFMERPEGRALFTPVNGEGGQRSRT